MFSAMIITLQLTDLKYIHTHAHAPKLRQNTIMVTIHLGANLPFTII